MLSMHCFSQHQILNAPLSQLFKKYLEHRLIVAEGVGPQKNCRGTRDQV